VYEHLQGQNVPLSHRQVRQAIEQSGWSTLRQELRQHFHWTKDACQLREEWIVQELLGLVQQLQTCLETGQSMPVEEQSALADVQTLAHELGIETPPTLKPLPWLLKVEQVLFGQWAMMEDDLLHIAIYPHNTRASAHVFLLALRAKGYHPKVVVTDLRRDYGPVIAQVFP
jgi:hypothetical protein